MKYSPFMKQGKFSILSKLFAPIAIGKYIHAKSPILSVSIIDMYSETNHILMTSSVGH